MPRSSRHKSHRQHRRNSTRGDARERSDSEEEERRRDDAVGSSCGARDSRDSGLVKRKGGSFLQGSEEKNGVVGGKHGEESVDLFVVVERWNGDGGDGKAVRVDELDEEKVAVAMAKAKGSGGGDWKEKSSRRHDGSGGGKERSSSDRDESGKRRSERDLSRSERTNQHGDVKEIHRERATDRDREYLTDRRKDHDAKKDRERESEKERERWLEKDREHRQERDREHRMKRSREQVEDMEREHGLGREVADFARERSSDLANRKSGSRLGDGECPVKGSLQNTDRRELDELHNPDLDKDVPKKIRRKDYYGDKEKQYQDDRDIIEKKLSSTDDRVRNGSYKDEKYKEERYREKYREDFDRVENTRYDKHRDGRSSRDHASGNHNKSRIEGNGRESSPYVDEYSMKYRDNREKMRFSDHIDVHDDPKSRNAKEHCMVETNIFDSRKVEVTDDRGRPETPRVEGSADNNRPVKSPNSSSQVVKNEYRSLQQAEATHSKSWSEERQRINRASSGDPPCESMKHINSASLGVLESHCMERKSTPKERPHDDFLVENSAASSQLQTTPQSDGHPSSILLSERVPSSGSGRRYSNRVDAVRHSDVEEVEQRTSYPKDGRGYPSNENKEWDFRREKQEATNVNSQVELANSESVPVGSVPYNRTDHFSSCSPSPLRPSSSVRHGMGSPVSGSDGDRFQAGDRKSNNRFKRIGDLNMGRGHGNAMKGVLNWSSPVPNGFIPFQHGPPPGGFYPVVQPFPAPMFGIRPPMDLNQSGNPFHMNENSDRFSGHSRPFGWRNLVDDPFPPNLQGWDGSNNIFNDGSYMHCRSEWEQKNHLINNSGSEMSSDLLKGQNGNTSMPYLASDKEIVSSTHVLEDEAWTGQSGHQTPNEQPKPEFKEVKGTNDDHSAKNVKEASPKTALDNTPVPSNLYSGAAFCSTCLSKLDISLDLASPELYEQWTKTVENKGNTTNDGNILDKNVGGVKFAVAISSRAGSPLFPALTDDVFQGALSLYRKDNEVKAKTPPSDLQSKEDMDTSEISDVDKIEPIGKISCEANLLASDNACSSMEEDDDNNLSEPKVDQDDLSSVANNLSDPKVDQGDIPSIAQDVAHDGQSDIINSAAGCVEGVPQDGQANITYSAAGCAEGLLECEAIMPDCRVNLSRIHHSPESTH